MIGTIKDYFYNTEAEKKLEQLLLEEHPDIAHIHLFWGGLSVSILRALHKYNIPIVHTAHDYRMVCPGYTFKMGKELFVRSVIIGISINACLINVPSEVWYRVF